ncbi:MAG: tetratricopeptide repeat protein [bacterium]
MTGQSIADRLRNRRGMALVLTAVALLGIVLYLPALRYKFVWDDNQLIVNNRLLAETRPWEVFFRGYWAGTAEAEEGPVAAYYRPVTSFSFWLDLKVAGLNPVYFHLINLVLAAGAGVLVSLIVWELLHSAVWAFLAGIIFVAHPAHVESVAFVSGRTDLLVSVFIGFAAFALLRSFRKRNRWWWVAVPVGFALGVLSKETALLFPLLVALTPLFVQSRAQKLYWLLVLVLVLVAGGYLFLRQGVFNQMLPMPTGGLAFDLMNIVNTFGYYIRMFFVPFEHHAKIPLDPLFLKLSSFFVWTLLFVISIPLAALRPRFRILLWGYAWTIVFLLPVSNIFPIGPQAAERLLFLPSVGLVALLVVLLSRLLVAHHQIRVVVGGALVVVTAWFSYNTRNRMPVWRDEVALFSAMVKEAPNAATAYANLAGALRTVLPDSAIKLYNRAILLDQGFTRVHINIAILYSQKGDFRRAIHHLRLADELEPNSVRVQNNLGYAFLLSGQIDSAVVAFERALVLDPSAPEPRAGQALAFGLAGRAQDAYSRLGELLNQDPSWAESVKTFIRQFRTLQSAVNGGGPGPDRALLMNRLGTMMVALTDTAEALNYYQEALSLDSNCVPALYNLALLHTVQGNKAGALRLISRAIKIRPDLKELQELMSRLR